MDANVLLVEKETANEEELNVVKQIQEKLLKGGTSAENPLVDTIRAQDLLVLQRRLDRVRSWGGEFCRVGFSPGMQAIAEKYNLQV